MSLIELNLNQLNIRVRELTDKLTNIWTKMEPLLKEYSLTKEELLEIIEDIQNREKNETNNTG